ncbi:pirin family protein [Aneurinibacillus uraniidurans]|uniref:pirin family protein n=1 Tax=Aneurinibacillus uraniidurans TaxID=2966586 RepID=UPI00234A9805|nr:pirin family protein [Aneurinibacillus sp. B1]WCN38649.1 pirin family protein [Aneurinibacillus sp. B1]
MAAFRSIVGAFKGAPFHMVGDGFRVSNYFPSGNSFQQRISPFILLDYNSPFEFPPSSTPKGVGAHPHRGFETVTIAYEGYVEHHDNAGNHGIIGPGDVQWMTAGSGVLHKEYQEKSFSQRGGELHMIQLWVNLPKQYKMSSPKYQALLDEQMSRVELPNDGGRIRIIAGELEGVKGPAQTFTPVNLFDITFKEHGKARFTLPSMFNTGLLVLKGKVKINETNEYSETDFVLFENEQGEIEVEGITENALVIVMSGEPINEPMIQYGPFVMNTKQEIVQAYEDFQSGKFGSPNF